MRNYFTTKLKYVAALFAFVLTTSMASLSPVLVAQAGATQAPPNYPSEKVFVCKYVGIPYVNERLQTGQNPIDVSVNAIKEYPVVIGSYFADQQGQSFVLAFDTGQPDPDVSQCPAGRSPTQIPVPAAPAVDDPCGSYNASWIKPDDSAQLDWFLFGGMLSVQTKAGYVFTDGTTYHFYGYPTDSNVACPARIPVPAAPAVDDPCGSNNATWIKPSDTTSVSWSISNGHLIATAKTGYVFTDGTTTHDFGTAPDSGTQCEKKVFVCKYVGTPGVDERLQTGQNPIDVSVNAIGEDPVVVGSYFKDAQGRSYVLAFDTGQSAPSASECPAPAPTEVTPGDVTFANPTCEMPSLGHYTVPTTPHVIYKNGSTVVTGTNPVSAPGSVTITAYPESSAYVLTGTTTWSHQFTVPNGCGGGEVVPMPPVVVVTPGACVPTLASTGSVTVTITNPNTTSVTYNIVLGVAHSQSLTLAGGATGSVTFDNLAAGTYTIEVSGSDDTDMTTSVTLTTCPATPGGGSGGHVLGESTTTPSATVKQLANTGTSVVLPTILAFMMALTATGVMLSSYMQRKSTVSDPSL